MAVIDPLGNEPSFSIPWSIETICILKLFVRSFLFGCSEFSFRISNLLVPPRRRRPQTPCSAQTGTTKNDLFFRPLLLIVTLDEATIKHLIYTRKVPFLYTERACVLFFRFSNSPRKIFNIERSVAIISDQREYILYMYSILGFFPPTLTTLWFLFSVVCLFVLLVCFVALFEGI